MNILVIRLKSIGDVAFTLPAVNLLRQQFPDANISFLTNQENAGLLAGFPAVNRVLELDRAPLRSGNPFKMVPCFFRLLRLLRSGTFDLVVDLQGYGETAWLTRITGASQRWGSVYGRGRQWAYTLGVTRDNNLHHVDRYLAILRAGGIKIDPIRNQFVLPESALTEAHAWFSKNQLDPLKPTLYLQPFTSSPHKNWPLENYIAVARHWQAQGGQVIFGGGPGDRARLDQEIAGAFPISAGVPLLTSAALMHCCRYVIGGDTGALHLAVALGRRVVMLMESIGPGFAYPFQHPDWAVTSPAGGTVPAIPVSGVLDAIG